MPNLTEAEILAQLEHNHDQYTEGATGMPVQDDQDARMALDDSPHEEVSNEEFTELNSEVVVNARGVITAEVYTGGNIVEPAEPPTFHEAAVTDAIQGGDAFTYGGPYTSTYLPPSPYVDALTLIEASKLTGEKWF